MRPVSYLAGVIAAVLLAAGSAQAAPKDCQLQIDPSPGAWAINGYDPLAGGGASGEFDVAFTNSGDQKCIGDVMLRLQGEPWGLQGPQGSRLAYTLVDQFNGVDITPRTGQSAPRRSVGQPLTVDPGQRLVQRYFLSVASGNLPGDGIFQQTVYLSFETRNGSVLNERPIALSVNVAASAVMGLKGAFVRNDNGARIDLGELTTGATNLPLELYVLSTRAYSIEVQSAHNGRLKLAKGDWYVPYSLTLGGQSINLAAGGRVKSPAGNIFHDDSYPLGVVVGDVSQTRAGSYSDVITLTVSPL